MAKFEVPVVRVERFEKHPNADRLDLVYFRDYATITAKLDDGSPRYKVGDLVIYVPEGALVPEYLLRDGFWDEKNNKGFLAGKLGNRVKAIKLRGVLSQGIMFKVTTEADIDPNLPLGVPTPYITNSNDESLTVEEGDDVAEFLGITKYEPEIPSNMAGEVTFIGTENTINYDIENLKGFTETVNPSDEQQFLVFDQEDDSFEIIRDLGEYRGRRKALVKVKQPITTCVMDGQDVVVTEKLHGTLCMIGWCRGLDNVELWEREFFCASKGLGAKGLVFKWNDENSKSNVYTKIIEELKIFEKLKAWLNTIDDAPPNKVIILGEVFGKGVQDLHYGQQKPIFRAFDIFLNDHFVDAKFKYDIFDSIGVQSVPVLWSGKFSRNKMDELYSGLTTFGNHNIKEGIVITTQHEAKDKKLGRMILKHVSPDYLTRKGETTEFN